MFRVFMSVVKRGRVIDGTLWSNFDTLMVYLLDNMIPRYATGKLEQKLQLML